QFTAPVDQAASSIRRSDAKLSHPDLVEQLNQRRAEGLTVDAYGSKRLGALKPHWNIMLIDGRLAVVGSLALAALSLDFRREVAMVVDEPSAIAELDTLFRFVATAAAKDDDVTADRAGGTAC